VNAGLGPNFTPLAFASARPRCALGDTAAFELRGDAKHGKDKLGKIRGCIDNWFGKRTQARPGALHVTGDYQKVGRVTLEAVDDGD
jgi:hypothetical protein